MARLLRWLQVIFSLNLSKLKAGQNSEDPFITASTISLSFFSVYASVFPTFVCLFVSLTAVLSFLHFIFGV